MTPLDEPAGVALIKAGWNLRRMAQLTEAVEDAVRTRDEHLARITGEYDRVIDGLREEYKRIRNGFATVQQRVIDTSPLLPDEIELAGEWLAEIPPPDEPPTGDLEH